MLQYDQNQVHYIVVTVILMNKEGKFLITKRADWEKAFPGKWTVPGGKLKVLDYILREKDTVHHWYNVFEDTAKRELLEEVGIKVNRVGYVTSMIYIRPDRIPCSVVSLYSKVDFEKVNLCNALIDYKWVSLEESKNYDLIEGIYEVLEILDRKLKDDETEEMAEWKKPT